VWFRADDANALEHVRWAVVFWVNLPVGAVSIAMFAIFLPERIERRPHRIDYAGAVLLIVGVGAPMLALVQARALQRGDIAALVGLGIAAFVALAVQEEGDLVCFRTGYDRVILMNKQPGAAILAANPGAGLDGRDERLLNWITRSGVVALISDNRAVEQARSWPCEGEGLYTLIGVRWVIPSSS
jgi:hypothetical protein